MTTKFTPGPWALGDENNESCEVSISNGFDLTVNLDRLDRYSSEMVISRSEMLANAHLIAAAPDLYQMLELVLMDNHVCGNITPDTLNKIEDVLLKARG